MRFALFFVVLLAVLGSFGAYVHWRTAEVMGLSRRGRRILAAVLAFGLVAMFGGRFGRAIFPDSILRALGMVGSVLSLAILISALLIGLIDLPGALQRGFAWLLARSRGVAARPQVALSAEAASLPEVVARPQVALSAEVAAGAEMALQGETDPAAAAAPALPRRRFLAQGAFGSAFLIAGSSSVYGALVGRHDYIIEETAIPIPGLSRRLDGFAIAQLSDIHLGLFVGEPEMRAAEDLVRKARPDLIVLTGDLIDFDVAYAESLGRLVRRLQPLAREGVAIIPGNHDHFAGVEVILDAAERAGGLVLRNRGRVMGGPGGAFSLLGVDDVWAERMWVRGGPNLDRALADVPPDLPRVLLCHNPVFFPKAAAQVALQLSGHTHGGQVNLVVRPADLVLPFGYVAGLYRRGDSQLYVNRGFGTAGPPVRVGSPPEVSRIVLVSA